MSPNRRHFLVAAAAVSLAGTTANQSAGQAPPKESRAGQVAAYLQRLARDDGGYAWEDQSHSHLTPTFAVIGSAHLLSIELPQVARLAHFVRTHHPMELKALEQEHRMFNYQQVQALVWLNQDTASLRDAVLSWQKPVEYMKQYEKSGYPVFSQEVSAILSRHLLGQSKTEIPDAYHKYLERCRRANGTFNNTPSSDGSDGHVLNTWWGLRAIAAMQLLATNNDPTIQWLQRCQLPNGGFTYRPGATVGAVDDVAYTWAAINSLKLLSAPLPRRSDCIEYILSLLNEDGGFGDRPGWLSNPLATYYALDTLRALSALDVLIDSASVARINTYPQRSPQALPENLNVYSIQIEAHGQGSPREAVLLAKSLKIHLWGAKNAKPDWIETAQALADQQQVPVRFFRSDEEYGTWISFEGMGTYSHTSDIVAPANTNIGSSLANQPVVTWEEYRQSRLNPLMSGGGRLVWQFGENEPLVRMLLDDSLERGGFAAISTFHFGNPDFINSEPFLQRYRMQLPFIALQDAHGPEPWWFADMTEGFRTLFLASEPTWDGFLKALKENWVVAVRHDAVSRQETWMHGGSQAVLDYVRLRKDQWQWWDNPHIQRPLASIQVLAKSDRFEAGRPTANDQHSMNVRVRCAWRNTPQGLAKQPLVSLLQLSLDGQRLETELITRRRPNGLYEEHFHLAPLPKLDRGVHTLVASLRTNSTEQQTEVTHRFTIE